MDGRVPRGPSTDGTDCVGCANEDTVGKRSPIVSLTRSAAMEWIDKEAGLGGSHGKSREVISVLMSSRRASVGLLTVREAGEDKLLRSTAETLLVMNEEEISPNGDNAVGVEVDVIRTGSATAGVAPPKCMACRVLSMSRFSFCCGNAAGGCGSGCRCCCCC